MKMNFHAIMFLLIVTIPFYLLTTKNTKTDKIRFVTKNLNIEQKEPLKIFEAKDGREKECFKLMKGTLGHNAYFFQDTIVIEIHSDSYSGYKLIVQIVGDEYTTKFSSFDCTSMVEMKIKDQKLVLEEYELLDREKLKGNYICTVNPTNKLSDHVAEVRIEGNFEMNLVDIEHQRKEGNGKHVSK